MTLICVASPKGGVGKTMVAAHLADEVRRAGAPRVVAVDLDPQNALRLHFGIPMSERFGISGCIVSGRPWIEAAKLSPHDVIVYPYGSQPVRVQAELEHALQLRPNLIAQEVFALSQQPETIVIVDTSPGYSLSLSSLLPIADMVVTVMTPEASCVSLVPEIHAGSCYQLDATTPLRFDHRIVINRFDPMNRVSAMAMPQLVRRFGSMLLGTIYRDEHIGEAFASQKLINHYAPHSRAAADLDRVGSQFIQSIQNLH